MSSCFSLNSTIEQYVISLGVVLQHRQSHNSKVKTLREVYDIKALFYLLDTKHSLGIHDCNQ